MKRWVKWIGIACLVPLAFIILLSLLLYFPPLQDLVKEKVIVYAGKVTGMHIKIDKIRLSFPLNLTVQKILIVNPPADTLLSLRSLQVRIKILPLLKMQVVADAVDLQDGQINSGKFIEGLFVKGTVGRIHAKADNIDLSKEVATLNSFELSDTHLFLRIDSAAADKDTASAPLNWKLALETMTFNRVSLELQLQADSTRMSTNIEKAELSGGMADLGHSRYAANKIGFTGSTLTYDADTLKKHPGLDPAHIALSQLQVAVDSLSFSGKTFSAHIQRFSFTEQSGLAVSSLEGSIQSNGILLEIPQLILKTPYSEVQLLANVPWSAFEEKPEGSMRSLLIASIGKEDIMLATNDLSEDFRSVYPDKSVSISAGIEGNLDKLELRGLKSELPGAFRVEASGQIEAVTDSLKRSGKIMLDAKTSNMEFILSLLNKKQRDFLKIPAHMTLKGDVVLRNGEYEANLTFSEDKALVILKGKYNANSENYNVNLRIDSLQPNHFMPKDSLFWLTASIKASGKGFDLFSPLTHTTIEGAITDIRYGRTSVSEIKLNASLKNQKASLLIESGYPLAQLKASLEGTLRKSEVDMHFKAQVNNLNLFRLHFVDAPLSTAFQFVADVKSNMKQSHRLEGKLDQWELNGENQTFYPKEVNFLAATSKDSTHISLSAGDAHLEMNGSLYVEELFTALNLFTEKLMEQYNQKYLDLGEIRPLLPNLTLQGLVGKHNPIHDLLALQNIQFNELSISALTSPLSGISGKMAVHTLVKDTFRLDTIRIIAFEDTAGLRLTTEAKINQTRLQKAYTGKLDGLIRLNQLEALLNVTNGEGQVALQLGVQAKLEKEDFVSAHLFPYNPIIAFRKFTLNPDNYIRYKDTKNMAANLRLTGEENASIWIHSVPDTGALQELHAEISQLDMSLLSNSIPSIPAISGILSADLQYSPSESSFMLVADAGIDELRYDNRRVGEMQLTAVYLPLSNNNHQVDIHFLRDRKEITSATASYQAGVRDSVSGLINITDFPLEIANPFIPDEMARMTGRLQGNLDIRGRSSTPQIEGFLQMDSAAVFVGAAGSTYRFDSKKLEIKSNRLLFSNYNLYAYGKNPFIINGDINFTDPSHALANLKLNGDNLQLVDVKRNNESLVYGKLFIDLNSTLRGPVDALTMRGNLQLLGNTDLTYVMKDSPLTVRDRLADLVTFTSFTDSLAGQPGNVPPLQLGGMDILLTIVIDPSVQLKADISADQESRVELEGGGDLYFQYTPQGDMFLNGRYTLSGGSILYTLPVIPKKKFTIQEDSYLEWSGDPLDPLLNLTATERVRASVSTDDQSPRQVNFDVGISLKQRMNDLQLVFTLEAPEDLSMQNQLSAMGEEERSKQAVSLLVTGMYLGGGSGTGKINLDMGTALNSFLQKEITNLAGSALSSVDISLGVENSEEKDGGKRTDYSFRFAKRFYNDRIRVVLGGRVSTGDVPEQTQSFIDNISFEYRLDNSGARYVKLFHNKNYESILEGEITETGVGLVLHKKMKNLGEFFLFKKVKKIIPVNEETKHEN